MSTHFFFPFPLIKCIESSMTPLSLCKWRQPTIVEQGTGLPGPTLSVSHSLEHSQAFAGLRRWPRHYSMHFWTSERGQKYKVWKNNSVFRISRRPGLSLCKLGSVRIWLFAMCRLHITGLTKIIFPTLASAPCLQQNSVLWSCQKTCSPACPHLHISKVLLQEFLLPKCPGSQGTEGTEKALKGSKLWEGAVWRYFTSDLADFRKQQKTQSKPQTCNTAIERKHCKLSGKRQSLCLSLYTYHYILWSWLASCLSIVI